MNKQLGLFDAKVVKAGEPAPKPIEQVIIGEGFDVKKFVESFPVLAAAEGGTRWLRRVVLSLAERGLLVEQRPNDGTGHSVAQQLRQHRANGGGKGTMTAVTSEEAPFELPTSWTWVRLGDCGSSLGGGTPSKANTAFWSGDIPWVSPKDMKRPYIADAEDHISPAAVEGSAVKLIPPRSLLLVLRGMILAHSFPVALTTAKVTINQDMKAIVFAVPGIDEFVLRACWAARDRVLAKVERSSHGTCRLDFEAVAALPIPLPPLEEQKRIVAKVDELMKLIDDLEAQQAKARQAQTRFRASALDALTRAAGPEELAEAWQRVAGNWEVLFERPESVGELRRASLELATRGALGTRRNSDEPAGKLWAQVAVERQRLLEGRRQGGRGKDVDADKETPPPPWLPETWKWCRLADVAGHIVDGTHHTPSYVPDGVAFISAKDIKYSRLTFDNCKYISRAEFAELSGRCRPRRGDVLVQKSGSIGDVAVVDTDREFTLFESVALVPVVPSVDARFVAAVVHLAASGQFGKENQKGVGVTHLHLVDLRRLPFPLPPLEEQHRIVAKVESLMKLCDDLETQLKAKEAKASKLVEAVVRELVGTPNAAPKLDEAPENALPAQDAAEGPPGRPSRVRRQGAAELKPAPAAPAGTGERRTAAPEARHSAPAQSAAPIIATALQERLKGERREDVIARLGLTSPVLSALLACQVEVVPNNPRATAKALSAAMPSLGLPLARRVADELTLTGGDTTPSHTLKAARERPS